MKHQVTIGLGSNEGNRLQHLQAAIECLAAFIESIECSTIYETAALLTDNAPESWNKPFLNMALKGETPLDGPQLLSALQRIETKLGRIKAGHWAPRTIDLDILTYDDLQVQSENLTIPHPEMLKRDFVLLPLAELIPDWQHPLTSQPIRQLAQQHSEKLGTQNSGISLYKEEAA